MISSVLDCRLGSDSRRMLQARAARSSTVCDKFRDKPAEIPVTKAPQECVRAR